VRYLLLDLHVGTEKDSARKSALAAIASVSPSRRSSHSSFSELSK